MNILVCGASGFIGTAICAALARNGHRVVRGVRHATLPDEVEVDFARDVEPAHWQPLLEGVDVVVNAAGILLERGAQSFEAIHRRGPIALFDASVAAGVRRIVQVSALGADQGSTAYFRSKRAADEHLLALPIAHHVVRPALVYGEQGASARFFRRLASLPVHFLPGSGEQRLRPVHVAELAEVVCRLVENSAKVPAILDLVGGTEVSYRDMLGTYRSAMGFAPAWRIAVPAWLIGGAAALLDRVPRSLLTRDTWAMLQAGNTADAEPTARVLGRQPAGIADFIGPADALRLRAAALAAWRPGVLRAALAFIWIWTAFCSAVWYPQQDSLALLAPLGLHGAVALVALYGASALDLLLGVLTLWRPGRRLWAFQLGLVTVYSLIVAIALPAFLWHPFAPLIKNAAVIALLVTLLSEEVES
ncbi:NAD-dependent dehydratase [Bordetella genomosp. 5]|uniref:SDR family oxidoreductase n=1 Tax=Bordetella genomosp. 5 TaxID=1395608 RepID=UPI000B9E1A6B|nr:SDR family oxidoreductase [Bordetella genomosp. 5]OZI39745.1 NAD-dependent dehydratase [Bordetella genomosp. 5]